MIYLDNAATSFPKAPGVEEAVLRALTEPVGNPGRVSHSAGREADKILFETRELLAGFFGVSDSSRFIFTPNATTALNTIISGFSGIDAGPVLTSEMEHNSVMRPLRYLESLSRTKIITFRSLVNTGGYPDLNDYEEKIKENKPSLAVFTGASNVSGIIFPVKELSSIAHRYGVPVCVDGAQLAGEAEIDLSAEGPDFFCFSGHKGLLGPAGTGGFYIADSSLVNPLIRGGTGSSSDLEIQPDFLPDKFESGTANVPGLAGLGEALRFLTKEGVSKLAGRRNNLCRRLIEGLHGKNGLFVVGDREGYSFTSTVSFGINEKSSIFSNKNNYGKDLAEITSLLDRAGVAVRMGYHCAPVAHKTLGTFEDGGTIRFSPGCFSCEDQIAVVIDLLTR